MDNLIEQLRIKLKEQGYKLTKQRRIIYKVIINNRDKHLSPEDIYEKVKHKYPEIGLTTVYRTLQLFEELGLMYKMNFNDGCSRYELKKNTNDHHHHLICLKCGKILEVELDLLENLELEIEDKVEFEIISHSVKFFGYCEDCRNNKQ